MHYIKFKKMTNPEVVTLIEKLHKTENNTKWKVRAALIGLGLGGIIYVLYRSVQTKSKLISIKQNEIETEKEGKPNPTISKMS